MVSIRHCNDGLYSLKNEVSLLEYKEKNEVTNQIEVTVRMNYQYLSVVGVAGCLSLPFMEMEFEQSVPKKELAPARCLPDTLSAQDQPEEQDPV